MIRANWEIVRLLLHNRRYWIDWLEKWLASDFERRRCKYSFFTPPPFHRVFLVCSFVSFFVFFFFSLEEEIHTGWSRDVKTYDPITSFLINEHFKFVYICWMERDDERTENWLSWQVCNTPIYIFFFFYVQLKWIFNGATIFFYIFKRNKNFNHAIYLFLDNPKIDPKVSHIFTNTLYIYSTLDTQRFARFDFEETRNFFSCLRIETILNPV